MKITRAQFHAFVYLLGLCILAGSIPLSRFGMSVGQLMLLGNWLVEGRILEKLKRFASNRAAMVLSLLFLLHVAGLFYTTDFDYAVKDLRTKVPLALLPLLFSSMPVPDRKSIQRITGIYILAVLLSSVISTAFLLQGYYRDIREISPFVSHIRLSLNVCLSIILLIWYFFHPPFSHPRLKIILAMLVFWFIAFLYYLESLSGIFILFILIVSLCIRAFQLVQSRWRWLFLGLAIGLPVFLFLYVSLMIRNYTHTEKIEFSKLERFTPRMNPYEHDSLNHHVVNGHYLWVYVCKPELRESWNKVSTIPFDGKTRNGQKLSDILIRYMASKGLRKDLDGFKALTPDDIRRVENGVTDASNSEGPRILGRLRAICWEIQNYKITGDPSGHSVTMRFEYWKASLGIIRHAPMGVGTGDMNEAFAEQYKRMNSELKPEWQRRSHNQFLSVTVGFGIIGLLIFLFCLCYPPMHLKAFRDFRFSYFFLIFILSMLVEDTIESQDGVTFAAFFFSFLLFLSPGKKTTFATDTPNP